MQFINYNEITHTARSIASELIHLGKLHKGNSVVVGCSTSEIIGSDIGTNSNSEVGQIVFDTLMDVFLSHGVFLVAACCEHLNRAIIIPSELTGNFQLVNVVPTAIAGGAFAQAAYNTLSKPVVLEHFYADAGLDIGSTLIGMHLKHVAVPLRLSVKHIGNAFVVAARTRPPFIGGIRATYDENLM